MVDKKNILIIPSRYPTSNDNISGSFVKEQADLFSEEYNVKVLYVTLKKYNPIRFPFEYILKKVKKKSNVQEIYDKPVGIRFEVNQVFINKFIKDYIPLFRLIEKINLNLIFRAYQQKIIELYANDLKPDLIHAHSVFNGGVYAYFLAKKYKIPYIITEHQPFILDRFSEYKITLYKSALGNANKVMAVSNHQKRSILQNGVKCNPYVVGNYIDENRFKLSLGFKEKENINLLTVMYAQHIKGYNTLFKGINHILEKGFRNFNLTVIGGNYHNLKEDDPDNPFLKKVKKYKLEKYVTLINSVSRNEMPHYYNNSDIFISTSISETFGMSMCESLISGNPVISSKNGGSADFLNENNSIVFNIGDYEALGEAIIKIFETRKNYNPQKIRTDIIEKYGRAAFYSNVNKIYKLILSKNI